MSINIRGSSEYLGGCMMSVSWHCIKPQERPVSVQLTVTKVLKMGGCEVMISSEEIVQIQNNFI